MPTAIQNKQISLVCYESGVAQKLLRGGTMSPTKDLSACIFATLYPENQSKSILPVHQNRGVA